jgi:hypothetical protein
MDICRWLKVKMASGKRGRASKGRRGAMLTFIFFDVCPAMWGPCSRFYREVVIPEACDWCHAITWVFSRVRIRAAIYIETSRATSYPTGVGSTRQYSQDLESGGRPVHIDK